MTLFDPPGMTQPETPHGRLWLANGQPRFLTDTDVNEVSRWVPCRRLYLDRTEQPYGNTACPHCGDRFTLRADEHGPVRCPYCREPV